jgi:hypothetical protein
LPAGAQTVVKVVPAILKNADTLLVMHLHMILINIQEEIRAIEVCVAPSGRSRARAA